MASVIHIAEVAAILVVAYGLGWVVGYVAHRLIARPVVAEVPAERVAAVTAPGDALVKAPVIEPVGPTAPPVIEAAVAAAVAEPAVPTATVSEPQPEVIATIEVAQELPPEPQPTAVEVVAQVEATPAVATLAPVAIPTIEPPPPMRVAPVPPPPKPAPEPEPIAEPEIVLTAAPALKPGEAWSGEVRGRTAEVVGAAPVEVAEAAPQIDVPLTIDLGAVGPDSTYGEPVMPAPVPPPAPVEEDAAMRAIEGGWSRVGARAMSGAPELSDVGAAVAAAQSAVEQVLARAGIDAEGSSQSARPKGLPRPRNGTRDDLKRIEGLGALDESTLNNLGVFHFDQIAGWSDAEVLWMENHVFARGRIGRENWQQQARELASAVAG